MNGISNHFFRLTLGLFIVPLLVFALMLTPRAVNAQDDGYADAPEKYSQEELAQMLAPIALYPDALLAQVLMASTYPIEVVEAERWVRANPQLKDESLDSALLDKDWDPAVKAVCHFPSVLALMSERISETTQLGNAFLAQEDEVMAMVQELRFKAYSQDNLTSTAEQKVTVERDVIIIEPADPRVVYVPYYDPFYVYGSWWYPNYPPYFWAPPGYRVGVGVSYWPGTYFSFSFGNWSYFDWPRRTVYIDVHKRPRYVRHDHWGDASGRWYHSPNHRRGVAYRDPYVARKYAQPQSQVIEVQRDNRLRTEDREHSRDRDGDNRKSNDRERRDADLERRRSDQIVPSRQERQREEHGQKNQEQAERQRREQARVEDGRKVEERDAQAGQERRREERAGQERRRVELDPQSRGQVPFGGERKTTQPVVQVGQEEVRDAQVGQERLRVEQTRQDREQSERQRKEQARLERDLQKRERDELDRQERQRVETERRAREQLERNTQLQEQLERNRAELERARVESERGQREQFRVEAEKQERQRNEGEKQRQDRKQRKEGDPVTQEQILVVPDGQVTSPSFGNVRETDRQGHLSSERGRNRRDATGDDSSDRRRSDAEDQGAQSEWGRKRY